MGEGATPPGNGRFSQAGWRGGGRLEIQLRLGFEGSVYQAESGFFFSGAIKHGDGAARLVNKFAKTKVANGACFLTYLNLLGASETI